MPRPSVFVIDGMALIQKLKVSDQMTFGQIADAALSCVSQGAETADAETVFDVYNEITRARTERRIIGDQQESHSWAKNKTV